MKDIIVALFIIIASASISNAQRGEQWKDSVKNEAKNLFNAAAKIEFIDLIPYTVVHKYPHPIFGFLGIQKKYTWEVESTIMMANSQLDTAHIGNRYELDTMHYDQLYSILYESKSTNLLTMCYNPRNGIIFYDSAGEMIGYVEICFECGRMYTLSGTPFLGERSDESYEELKTLFEAVKQ